ncbi:MAG: 6-pyruvoyl-tetrahydropterin synthase-related protein, partial [Desulfarculaceae bacterium]
MSSGAQKDYGELVLDLVVLAGIWLLLLAYFPPELLFSKTTTTGGDTGSHFYTAWYLKEHLLPQGRILGWVPGNLAGYPLFQLYFPLPFLAMALLGWLIPLQVAFKLVTAAGAFLLPLCAWQGLRLSGRRFPIPILGAVFTLPFLFNETQSMWGGNLPSLLAGEFCYSLGLALLVYFLGSWHRGIHQGKRVVLNGLLLALIGLCHGCTLLFGILAGGLWLLHRDLPQRLVYLLKVYGLAFLLMGFWIVPLLAFSPYNTLHNMTWHIDSWRKVIPPIMMPLMAMVLAHLAYLLLGKQKGAAAWGGAAFFPAVIALAMVLYLVAFHLNVIDIRFIPFAWLALCLWAAIGAGSLCRRLRARLLTPILALVLTALWLGTQVTYIPQWIKWNYQGFEHSPGWEDFAGLSRNLRGGPADPRVLHEHADVHQRLGTTRAFENLPLFAGRNTMEGLYIQSGLNSPFVFYLQSLTSQTPTTPLPEYVYSRFDLKRALPRMILYNVGEFIAVSHKTRQAALKQPGLSLSSEIGPYSIFQVDDNPGTYAVPLKYKPVLVLTRRWKELAFAWFRRGDLEVPLVFKTALAPGDQARYAAIWKDRLGRAPRVRLADTDQFQEKVG